MNQTFQQQFFRLFAMPVLLLLCAAQSRAQQGLAAQQFGFGRTDSLALPTRILINPSVKDRYYQLLHAIPDTAEQAHFLKLDSLLQPDLQHQLAGIAVENVLLTTYPGEAYRMEPALRRPTGDFFQAELTNDSTLQLRMANPFADYFPEQIITRGLARSYWNIWHKYDRTARAARTDTFTNRLQVPAHTLRMVLSDSLFVPGKVLYGAVQLCTAPYFEQDDDGTEKQRQHYLEYCFKAVIVTEAYQIEAERQRHARYLQEGGK